MADNSLMGNTADSIRDKDRSGIKTQIMGLDVGIGGGTELLMSSTNAMPVWGPDNSASGTLSATDTVLGVHGGAGVLLTGTPTTSSYLACALSGGEDAWTFQLSGTFGSGTVWFECSVDSTTGIDGHWTTLSCRVLGTTGSTVNDSVTIAGLYRGNCGGMTWVRLRVTGATSPSIAVVIRLSDAVGPVGFNTPLVAGANVIGSVAANPAATGTITSPALSLTSFTVLASNTARKGATVYNDSNNTLYLALAATASVTAYTLQIPPNGYYELPGASMVFTGLISGISLAATGNARVTELT